MSSGVRPGVEFYFDFSSPYSYLASTRIDSIAARHGALVEWKPILLGPIFRAIGKLPLLQRPVEGAFARTDLRRWAGHLGIRFAEPPVFPVESLKASRGCFFAEASGLEGEYCRRVLKAAWGDGRDVGRIEELEAIARDTGLDAAGFVESLSSPPIKQRLRDRTDEAARRGVFGAPTFFVGDEMFYGNDRLFMLEEYLAELGAEEAGSPTTPYNRWFGIRCITREGGRAEYDLIVEERLLNRRGVAHGGAATSLLDTALGAAVVSAIEPQEWCATLELSVQFREPLRPGRVIGRGRMTKRGRHAAFAEGEIVDERGSVLASAHGTWYVWPVRPGR